MPYKNNIKRNYSIHMIRDSGHTFSDRYQKMSAKKHRGKEEMKCSQTRFIVQTSFTMGGGGDSYLDDWSSHSKDNMGLILGETISSIKTVWKKEVIHPLNKEANIKTNMQVYISRCIRTVNDAQWQ